MDKITRLNERKIVLFSFLFMICLNENKISIVSTALGYIPNANIKNSIANTLKNILFFSDKIKPPTTRGTIDKFPSIFIGKYNHPRING